MEWAFSGLARRRRTTHLRIAIVGGVLGGGIRPYPTRGATVVAPMPYRAPATEHVVGRPYRAHLARFAPLTMSSRSVPRRHRRSIWRTS